MSAQAKLIRVAKGESPADLVLANARIVNVFTGEIEPGNVAIYGDRIAGVGDYANARQVIDVKDSYIAPGLINGHIHPESSMLDITQYARAVVPRGTLGLVTDLHEIANVSGLEGIRYVLDSAGHLPLGLFLMAPSCVPATHLETAGASLEPEEIRQLLRLKQCIGLGEMMNFPGVLFGVKSVLRKIAMAQRKVIDGHAPGLSGKNLTAYISAGISSDHESVTLEEAREKLSKGMYVMIREGSSEKNLDTLLPLITDKTYRRCLFVVDDRTCADLMHDGDIDAVVRKAILRGLEPVRAIQLATINTAERFRLSCLGAIAPGYFANLILVDDLQALHIDKVFYHGKMVASAGKPLFQIKQSNGKGLADTVHIKPFRVDDFRLPASGNENLVIEVVPRQIITRNTRETVKVENGVVVPDIERDILKIVVVERHKGTGNIGVGLVKGFGLKLGALASSVAHDSHNIVAVGTSDEDLYAAVRQIERMHGGLVATSGGRVLAELALPVAGLLSDKPLEKVVVNLEELEKAAAELGTKLVSPFATLSFLALPVIPELRLTDLGLVDVNAFKLVK
ncbi:adenine deaminase [Chloroflexota bacterium]